MTNLSFQGIALSASLFGPLAGTIGVVVAIALIASIPICTLGSPYVPAVAGPDVALGSFNDPDLAVSADGQIFVAHRWIPDHRLAVSTLRGMMRDRPDVVRLSIAADRRAKYRDVERALALAREAGKTRILLSMRATPVR